MEKIRGKFQKLYADYKHLLLLLYLPIYLAWFAFLEKNITTHFHVIHMEIDDYIPFCEYFIVPYLLWFLYVAVTMGYMGLKDRKEFGRMCAFLFTGMTIFLIVSTVYPNGHMLRPTEFARDNVFTWLCSHLYMADTSTNLFPSIHVFNSVGVHLALTHSEKTRHILWLRISSAILMTSIILSTVFLKQHSVFDLLTGLMMAVILYMILYVRSWENAKVHLRNIQENIRKKQPYWN